MAKCREAWGSFEGGRGGILRDAREHIETRIYASFPLQTERHTTSLIKVATCDAQTIVIYSI